MATTAETGSASREPRPDRRRALLVAALGFLQLATYGRLADSWVKATNERG